jgi:hypothetical protein
MPLVGLYAAKVEVAVFDQAGELAAVAIVEPAQQRLRPEKVLPASL